MRRTVTITVTRRNFDPEGVLRAEVEKKYDLRLIYAFMVGSVFGSIMAAVGLILQGINLFV